MQHGWDGHPPKENTWGSGSIISNRCCRYMLLTPVWVGIWGEVNIIEYGGPSHLPLCEI